jgi:hypothetical protein
MSIFKSGRSPGDSENAANKEHRTWSDSIEAEQVL